ncbi:uroporphyrinogen-III synthase [Viridibacterium curvum]|uniref:Uroporphyrinogen-III synthase n=1 Tax=Viridibacterium curvum TaxID=1101404 RepID=A0ABP9QJ48_9RHOO
MPEARRLTGRRVVITRPAPQADGLIRLLQTVGAEPIFFPVIDILPLADTAPLAALADQLAQIDAAFFVSRNAVAQTLAVLPRERWPDSVAISTVGPGSAADLRAAGFADVLVPATQFDSEGVLALEVFSAAKIAGKRVLILRGDGGRELLAEVLQQRGAIVQVQPCYRRMPAQTDATALREAWRHGGIDALSFTSSEGARNFASLLGEEAAALLASCACFVPHERIAQQLRGLGARSIRLTEAGDVGLVAALQEHFA